MNVVAYVRVSTDAQAGEDRWGIPEQKSRIISWAKENGHLIIGWFIDRGESGVKESRPALNKLLYGPIENPPAEMVVVVKSDRLARDIKLYYYFMMLLEKKGMKLVSITEPEVDDGTGLGNIYKALMLFVAEQERKNIAVRTAGGRNQKARTGGYSGGNVPYGYKAEDKQLKIQPFEAAVAKKIFEMRGWGYTLERIANLLNKAGIHTRTNKLWSAAGIASVLKNEDFYKGIYRYKEVETVGMHEPLIVGGVWKEFQGTGIGYDSKDDSVETDG